MYVRKTTDEYHVESLNDGIWSTECIEETKADAWKQLRCYRENLPNGIFRVKLHRVPKE